MAELKPVGPMLDALDIRTTLPDGALVSSAVVLMEVIMPDGGIRSSTLWSEGQSYLVRRGLLEHALDGQRSVPSDFVGIEEADDD